MAEISTLIASIEWIILGVLVFVKFRKLYKRMDKIVTEVENSEHEE